MDGATMARDSGPTASDALGVQRVWWEDGCAARLPASSLAALALRGTNRLGPSCRSASRQTRWKWQERGGGQRWL